MSDKASECPYLQSHHIAHIGTYIKASSVFLLGLTTFHVATCISVLPYVWVSDKQANCGARMVLSYSTKFMYMPWAAFAISIACWALILVINEFLKRNFEANGKQPFINLARPAYTNALILPFGVTALFTLLVALNDVAKLSNPPDMPATEPALTECAKQTVDY